MLARLDALESDNAVVEQQPLDDDDEASLDDEDQGIFFLLAQILACLELNFLV